MKDIMILGTIEYFLGWFLITLYFSIKHKDSKKDREERFLVTFIFVAIIYFMGIAIINIFN